MQILHKITPCLWFENEAEEAARFYTAIFPNSRIGSMARYGKEGYEIHRQPEGTVMTVEFYLEGQPFTALNGGPVFKFNAELTSDPDSDKSQRATKAMLQMKKLDIEAIRRAYDGPRQA